MNNVSEITKNVRNLTSPEGSLTQTLNLMEETMREVQTDYKQAEIKEKIDKMFALVETTQKTIDTINLTLERSKEHIDKTFVEMSDGMSNFNEFTRIIMENPASLFGTTTLEESK
jgi:uncharacterized protein YaaN involved in tellurite resistance